MTHNQISDEDRYLGCLLGLATGDAIGTTVEFAPRGSFPPVVDMVGGGPFNLKPGEWTDDTSMALCLAHSLLYCKGFDPADQMNRYCNWMNHGYMSSNGDCFDIGGTVSRALRRYEKERNPFSGSVDPGTAGNGAIMRLAPVPMYFARSESDTIRYCAESARTTHGASEALDCARLFGVQLRAALLGAAKEQIVDAARCELREPLVARIARGAYKTKTEGQIRGTGYIVASLEAALWCFVQTDSYSEAVLRAANLGEDADTTAAICGQLAGAYYGVEAIPERWRAQLALRTDLETLAQRLLAERAS